MGLITLVVQEKKVSLFYFFEATYQSDPHALAIWSREQSYTRGDLYRLACQYGNHFRSVGVEPGDMVALYHTNTAECILVSLGLWSIGASPAMINVNLAAESLEHCVRISGAKLLVVDQDQGCQDRINGSRERLERDVGVQVVTLDSALKRKIADSDSSRPPDSLRDIANSPKAIAVLYYTR